MKKLLLGSIIFLFFNFSFSQGLKYASTEEIENFTVLDTDIFGFSGDGLPSSFSLEKYVPFVLNQGQTGACVGFSTLYYGLSTSYNFKYGYTKQMEKYANSFDPYFIYTIIKIYNFNNNLKNKNNNLVDQSDTSSLSAYLFSKFYSN